MNIEQHQKKKKTFSAFSFSRSLAKETEYIEEMVETSTGRVLVAHSGDRSKPVSSHIWTIMVIMEYLWNSANIYAFWINSASFANQI